MFPRLKRLWGKREKWIVSPEDIKIFILISGANPGGSPTIVCFHNTPEDIAALEELKGDCELNGLYCKVYKGFPCYLSKGEVIIDTVRVATNCGAINDARERLRDGTAEWESMEEVFGEDD